ncbi:nucleoside triphosphate pyrophosphohydrolase [Halanaerobium sp. Z-7514]|uniref:Nucleoside triphosphate pyrophosphohydrolase n=1 Tax=Halanaerobium polyolivorans TaxID=2886943 RepID=A0AAW4WYA7_9FIRM|nr:nucleoside triphosphate pyrophosphohydrolase [Halanaerobium polyolivorans]MCC3144422.1 nucleoside triphosphate pyrophosphohydrolase [Halanaerobium polyolivorans]RQD78229.1 MAG: nucleoside triphosphate pyrophosphohydrolase [Halanaerobium sp. MSAO_Bac5]
MSKANIDNKTKNKILSELDKLIDVMALLRGPNGCPWDKKQDYHSIKENIIEEAYEVVEALEKNDIKAFKEELGDLLLQVVFEAQMAYEEGDFDLGDVSKTLREKLIRRHPHVFEGLEVSGSEEVLHNWEEIKKEEKKDIVKSLMDNSSQGQSALNQAYEVQAIAAEVGFDWDDLEPVLNKIEEELNESKEIIYSERDKQKSLPKKEQLESEIGDLLFAVVNLARFENINPELALLKTVLKFKRRFKFIEESIEANNLSFDNYSLDELDEFWQQAKEKEKQI